MTRLALFFLSKEAPQLDRVEYEPSSGLKRVTSRGQSAVNVDGSFPWTNGVKALALLLVRSKAQSCSPQADETIFIEGEHGSFAAALDSALAKSPTWLIEMFGSDSHGVTSCRRLFKRVNPELKRAGPVKIGLNTPALPTSAITIFLDGIALQDHLDLGDLEAKLLRSKEKRNSTGRPRSVVLESTSIARPLEATRFPRLQQRIEHLKSLGNLPAPFSEKAWLPNTLKKLTADITMCLRHMDIFSLAGQSYFIKRINENSLYRKLTKRAFEPYHTVRDQPDFLRLGIAPNPAEVARDLTSDIPIHVFHPTGPYAAPLIFNYLKYVKGYSFETHGRYYCGTHLVADVLEARVSPIPDALILGMDAAGFLLSSQTDDDYIPFMILPLSPHIIITPKHHGAAVESSGDYILQKDPYDCCKAYFRCATETSFVQKRKIATHHITPDLAFQLLREGREKVRLPTGLEYFRLVEAFHDCHVTKEPVTLTEGSEVVLLLHRRLLTRARAINIELAIRDAWLSMSEDPEVVSMLLEQQILDPGFLVSVKRFSGLYEVSPILGSLKGEQRLHAHG